jgi:acetoacetate decarboxylase
MSFLSDKQKISPTIAKLYKAEIMNLVFETDMKAVKRILPPPLEPPKEPLASYFVATYGRTSFGALPYKEAALFVRASYKGVSGNYCPSMLVTNDIALIQGREICGFPKKIGEINITREGEKVVALVRRKNKDLAKLHASLNRAIRPGSHQPVFGDRVYLFKYFWNPELTGFDYDPKLIEIIIDEELTALEEGEGMLSFGESKYDPLHEIPPLKILGATYSRGNIYMNPSKVIDEVKPKDFMPYCFNRYI